MKTVTALIVVLFANVGLNAYSAPMRHPRVGRGPEVWRTAVLPLHQCRESTAALWCE